MKRFATATVAAACFVVFSAAVASAAWTKTGTGNGAAKTDSLAKPAGTAAVLGATSIRVSWTAPVSGAQLASTYVVRRVSPSATVCTIAQPETTTSCDDTGLTAATLYNYTIEATLGTSWTSGQSNQFSATTTSNLSFTVAKTVVGNATSNTAFGVTITAKNGAATDTTVTGAHTLTFTGPSASPSGTPATYPASVTFTAGVGTPNVTLMKAETVALTVTEASPARTGTSANITVDPGAATQFVVANPGSKTAGSAFSVGVTAQDLRQNTATTYTGAKTLVFTGPANAPDGTVPTYPAGTTTFSAGTASPSVTLFKAASTTLTVTQSAVSGTSTAFTVSAGAIAELTFTNCSKNGGAAAACGTTVSVANNGFMDGFVSLADLYGNAPTVTPGAVWSVTLTSDDSRFVVTLSPVTITGPATESATAFHVKYNGTGAANATITAHATSGAPSVTDATLDVAK
jgi:hypothetical protein